MNRERAIQTIALRNVLLQDDPRYQDRVKMRWYSKQFHTPLHVVESEIPFDDVLRHYWESVYAEMRDSDNPGTQGTLETERQLLSMTDEEIREARREQDASDADVAEELISERAAAGQVAKQVEKVVEALKELPEDVDIEFDLGSDAFGAVD